MDSNAMGTRSGLNEAQVRRWRAGPEAMVESQAWLWVCPWLGV